MADPLTVVGAVSVVARLINLAYQTVTYLQELHDKYNEADFTLINLISQLTALRTGLDKIHEWMSSDSFEPHHQLVMDLEVSISCCRMLITKLNGQIADLRHNTKSLLDFKSKMKLITSDGELDNIQKMIDRQTGALTLLLTACNCKAISEQKALLEQRSSRKVFQRVRDDTSSLYVQRDSSSMVSHWTGTLSKISRTFDFDRELFVSKVYEKALRGSLKNTVELLRRGQPQIAGRRGVTSPEKQKSQNIDKTLKQESKKSKREIKVLLLGDAALGLGVVQKMRNTQNGGYTDRELESYTAIMRKNLVNVIEAMASFAARLGPQLDNESRIRAEFLQIQLQTYPSDMENGPSAAAAMAAQQLWKCAGFRMVLLGSKEIAFTNPCVYLIEESSRIVHENYTPTETDVLKITSESGQISETRFTKGSLTIVLFNVPEQRLDEKKWIHSFEDVTSIVFCVDIATYDQRNETSDRTKMKETIDYFDSIVNSRWFRRTSIILLFLNTERFRAKLTHIPLKNTFPSYNGSNDFPSASKYILKRFNARNAADLSLYSYFTEADDPAIFNHLFAAIKETILNNSLQESSILQPAPKALSRFDDFPPPVNEEPPGYKERESPVLEDYKSAVPAGEGYYAFRDL